MLPALRTSAFRRAGQSPLRSLGGSVRFEATRADTAGAASSSISGLDSKQQNPPESTTKEILRKEVASEANDALTKARADGDAVAAGVVSGAPQELLRRPVRIYQPSQESTQSAKATSHHWRIDFDTLPGAGRWENGLMGWASSADYMQGTHLKFNNKQDAIEFAQRQGWSYFLQEPHHVKFTPKSYANNFLYSKEKLRYIRTK